MEQRRVSNWPRWKASSISTPVPPMPSALAALVVGFACWTLLCHLSVAAGFSFATTARVGWLCLLLGGGTFVGWRWRTWETTEERGDVAFLIAIGVIGAIITLVSHRPDADDTFYLSLAAHALAHPNEAVLSQDTLYGESGIPLLLAVYKISSFELLSAAISFALPIDVRTVYYLVIPTAFAVFLPFCWAIILRILAPDAVRLCVTALFLIFLVAGEAHWSAGNFGYVRMFQGKAVLVSLLMPLIYSQAWRFSSSGSSADWLLLASICVAAVGSSVTALFLVPPALGLALLSCWSPNRTVRSAAALAIALYPVCLAVFVREQTTTAIRGWLVQAPDYLMLLKNFFGAHQIYVLLPLAFLAWLGVRTPDRRRWILVLLIGYVAGPANPAFADFISAHITSAPLYWRVFWILPWPILTVLGLIGVARLIATYAVPAAWRGLAFASVLAGFAIVLLPFHVFRTANGVKIGSPNWKVAQPGFSVAEGVVAQVPPGVAVVAPEDVAIWIPTMVRRPAVLLTRELYGEMLLPFRDDVAERVLLHNTLSGKRSLNEASLNAIDRFVSERNLGAIVVADLARAALGLPLSERGFVERAKLANYSLFVLAR